MAMIGLILIPQPVDQLVGVVKRLHRSSNQIRSHCACGCSPREASGDLERQRQFHHQVQQVAVVGDRSRRPFFRQRARMQLLARSQIRLVAASVPLSDLRSRRWNRV